MHMYCKCCGVCLSIKGITFPYMYRCGQYVLPKEDLTETITFYDELNVSQVSLIRPFL